MANRTAPATRLRPGDQVSWVQEEMSGLVRTGWQEVRRG